MTQEPTSLLTRPRESEEDILDRQPIINFLTNHLSNTDCPFVFNIDSPWGTGKSFFLRQWKKSIEEFTDFKTVFFNAWEADSFKDAFTPLVHELTTQLATETDAVDRIRQNSGKLVITGVTGVLKALVVKYLGDDLKDELKSVIDDFGKIASEDLSLYAKQKTAIDQLKLSLKDLVKDQGKIFIFIDELDRCKPLFAIEVLERIKHLFDVSGLIFIIATDRQQLCHSIKAVYGEGFDSESYLCRFFDQSYTLPEPSYEKFVVLLEKQNPIKNVSGNSFDLNRNFAGDFSLASELFQLSLRDQQQVFIRVRAVIDAVSNFNNRHSLLLIVLASIRLKFPMLYEKYYQEPQSSREISDEFLGAGQLKLLEKKTFKGSSLTLEKFLSYYAYDSTTLEHNWSSVSQNARNEQLHLEFRLAQYLSDLGMYAFNHYSGIYLEHIKALELVSNLMK